MDLMQNSFQKALIFDIGNGVTKFGFSSDAKPSNTFDTVIRTKLSRAGDFQVAEQRVTGKKAAHPCLYRHEVPISRGILKATEDVSIIFRHMLEEMKAKTLDNIPAFVCDSLNSSASQRFRLAEILTSDFKTNFMYFADQPTLALYGCGKTSGCVVDVGHGTTQVSCVFDNFKISQCCDTLNVGGVDVEDRLAKLLQQGGISLNPASEYLLVREIKEKYCENRLEGLGGPGPAASAGEVGGPQQDVTLPDGEVIQLDEGRVLAPEVLFNPSAFNSKTVGIPQFLRNTIERADISLKNEFYADITVVGGVAQTANFLPRFRRELEQICHSRTKISVQHRNENPGWEAWIGARAVLTSNSYDFGSLWISKNDLSEFGEQVLFRKCN